MAPGVELLLAPQPLQATPLQFTRPTEGFSAGPTLGFDLQSSQKTKPAESNMTKAIKGRLLSIRIRIATVTHAATISVAQIEFAASQKRQEVTKLDEKESDGALGIRFCTASGEKLLMYR